MWKKINYTFANGNTAEVITRGVAPSYLNVISQVEVDYPEYQAIIDAVLAKQAQEALQ